MLLTLHTVPIDERLLIGLYLIRSVAHLNAVSVRILEKRDEEFSWCCDMRIMTIGELEEAALDVEGQMQGLTRDGAGIGAHNGLQCPPARIDVLRIGLLVAREDGEIFVIPQVAALVGVVGSVVPERAVEQVGFDGLKAAI